jgi:hypothetical protein
MTEHCIILTEKEKLKFWRKLAKQQIATFEDAILVMEAQMQIRRLVTG